MPKLQPPLRVRYTPGESVYDKNPNQRDRRGRLAGAVKPPVSSKNAHSPSSSTSMRQPSSELPATEFMNQACAASAPVKFFVAMISPCGPITRNLGMRCGYPFLSAFNRKKCPPTSATKGNKAHAHQFSRREARRH